MTDVELAEAVRLAKDVQRWASRPDRGATTDEQTLAAAVRALYEERQVQRKAAEISAQSAAQPFVRFGPVLSEEEREALRWLADDLRYVDGTMPLDRIRRHREARAALDRLIGADRSGA